MTSDLGTDTIGLVALLAAVAGVHCRQAVTGAGLPAGMKSPRRVWQFPPVVNFEQRFRSESANLNPSPHGLWLLSVTESNRAPAFL